MGAPEVLIRKYSDRRLYDTSSSRYVKLEDIAQMVREGVNVRVVDGRTGKDLTHLVFTQIIVENAREREIALPLQLLTQLVRASDKATHDFLTWYLDSTLNLYKKAQESVQTRVSAAKDAVSTPLEFVRNLLAGHSLQAQTPTPNPQAQELEELRRQLEALQARMVLQDKRGKPARSSAKRKRTTPQTK
jgi:polyhydroxyalkanoate synthesis repressor PhaR